MSTIKLEVAKAISANHRETDKIDDHLTDYLESSLTPEQSCAALLVLFARSLRKTPHAVEEGFGAKIFNVPNADGPCYQVKKGNSSFIFEDIPKVLLATLCCRQQNCHQNCINACANGLPFSATIHTSEISVLPKEMTGLDGILHSYVQLGNIIFDFDLGIRMSKSSYDTLFNVKEISTVEAKKINADYTNGTISKLSEAGVCAEDYLMARDDCSALVSKNK